MMGEFTELYNNTKELSVELDHFEIVLRRLTEQNRSNKVSN